MAMSVETQLKTKFPLRSNEDLNILKEKTNLSLLGEKKMLRSQIITASLQELAAAENSLREFFNILHSYNCDLAQNSQFITFFENKTDFARLKTSKYPETKAYLAPVLAEINNGSYFIKDEIQKIYRMLSEAHSVLLNQARAYKKGEDGEEFIKAETAYFSTKYPSLFNIRIPSENADSTSVELDTIFFTNKAVLLGEIKCYGNSDDTYAVDVSGRWFKKSKDGREETLPSSPSRQNMVHSLAVEEFFRKHGLPQIKIVPVILWASKSNIQNYSCTNVIRPEMLYDFVEQLPLPEQYDEELLERIMNLFKENDLGDNTFNIQTFNHTDILETTKGLLQYMADMYDTAKQATDYKPKYPVTKYIKTLLPIILVIALIIHFWEFIAFGILAIFAIHAVIIALGIILRILGF